MRVARSFAVFGAVAMVGLTVPAASAQQSGWLQNTFGQFQAQGNHQQAVDVLRSVAENVAHRLETSANHLAQRGIGRVSEFMKKQAEWLRAQLPNAFGALG